MIENEQHTSLSRFGINYSRKKFLWYWPMDWNVPRKEFVSKISKKAKK
jgi:hypothetical protein